MALPFPKKKNNNFKSLIDNDQEGFWLKKAWRQGKKALAKANEPPKSRGLLFEALEPRVLMSADLSYGQMPGAPTDLTLTFTLIPLLADKISSGWWRVPILPILLLSIMRRDAGTEGINITGTSGNDVLRLDLGNLQNGTALLFQGDGIDTLKATGAGGDDFP